MEPVEEWSSLSGLYTADEADFMSQLLGLHGHESTILNVTTGINKSSYFSENAANANFLHSSNIFPSTSGTSCYLNDPLSNTGYGVSDKECDEALVSEPVEEDRRRSRRWIEAHKNKRNVKPGKKQKTCCTSNTEEDTNGGIQGLSLSNCCSEDDSNASQKIIGEGSSSLSPKDSEHVKINGKSRCSRGSATDPQSIYARRRRERINERLKILQTLVPNGTKLYKAKQRKGLKRVNCKVWLMKVDISTMLEEAVEYVKFLQVQIKLLSSDDLWMYAPIAYNGMNIGLDLNLTPTKQS